jgi:hypothetical protein
MATVTFAIGVITGPDLTITSLDYCRGDAMNNTDSIPFWERYTLTIREAAQYFHIGENRLRLIVDENPHADFVLMNGNRVMIKKKLFEKYIDSISEI